MKKVWFLTAAISLLSICLSLNAQTILNAGDMAFVGLNSDGNDDFSFVLLKDIEGGTIIHITDRGWNDGSNSFFTDPTQSAGDYSGLVWTATSPLSKGQVVHIKTTLNGIIAPENIISSAGNVSGSILVSYTGDQLFAYQGTESNPTFLAGIHYNVEFNTSVTNWDEVASSNKTSALPDQLSNGENAIWLYGPGFIERDNFLYNGSLSTGTPEELRRAINNISNWNVDDSNTTPYDQENTNFGFNVLNSCVEPDIPGLSANTSSICSGESATISISGSLNDATHWAVYTNACGLGLIGTTSSSSYSIAPGQTTTYYIRGEGGCVSNGSCGTFTISVNPVYNLTETAEVCSGDSYTFPDGTTQDNITTTVVYTSMLTSENGCDSIINTTLNVNPVYNLTETAEVCSGDSYTFPDGTTQDNITTTVVYTSMLTSENGCDSIINTTLNVNPVYNLTETAEVCSGDSYTFPDGTTQDNITTMVVYTSMLTSENGCDSIINTTLNVKVVDLVVTVSESTLTAKASDATYQWLDCNNNYAPIPEATDQDYQARQTGNYAVEIYMDGCVDTSDCVPLTIAGLESGLAEASFRIYPNPTDGTFTIDLHRDYKEIRVIIRDVQGKILDMGNYYDTKVIRSHFDASSGFYFVELNAAGEKTVLKLLME